MFFVEPVDLLPGKHSVGFSSLKPDIVFQSSKLSDTDTRDEKGPVVRTYRRERAEGGLDPQQSQRLANPTDSSQEGTKLTG